ncbi:protein of unknown function DUF547, partial [Dillenia turbinata]
SDASKPHKFPRTFLSPKPKSHIAKREGESKTGDYISQFFDLRHHQSSVELMGEIAELEVEIIQLERFLLSLYQKAFGQHVPTLAEYSGTHLQCQIGMGLQAVTNEVRTKLDPNMVQCDKIFHHQTSSPSCWDSTKSSDGRTAASPTALPAMNIPFKLQNFVYVKLSEDMISCMSSIYCQLAEPPLAHGGHLASPMSSLSSSSTFSTQKHNDSWSPQSSEETTVHCRLLAFNEENGPYNAMLEAFLVYGTHNNQAKNATILKLTMSGDIPLMLTSYNAPFSESIRTNLHRRKSKPGVVKHVYAIENPEPLVHFALCLGAFSDPAVRKYTANNMVEDLRLAR